MDLKGKQADNFHKFHKIINKYRDLLDKLSASEIASVLVDELGLVSYFKEEKTPEASERLENVQELLNSIEEFCKRNSSAGLKDFLEEVSLLTDLDEWEKQSNSVTLMTIHSAKGLEFPVVFITGMEDGLFPIARCLEDPKELEEERRLFYVGLTRAKERAYLHYSTNRRKSSGIVGYGIASRFIHEIPGEFIERIKFESAVTRQLVREEKTGKYKLAWGIGRHVIGSQIFDYWRDPWGRIHEHWTDSDMVNANHVPELYADYEGLVNQWGPDFPETFLDDPELHAL